MMIYDTIEERVAGKLNPVKEELTSLTVQIEETRVAVKEEDSKSKERELRDGLRKMMQRQRELWHERDSILNAGFREALAEEYGVVENPKFDKAFSLAWDFGHAYGFSEIENYFMQLVELIK